MVKLKTLQIWWNELNERHFQGALQSIPIRITRSKHYWGKFIYGSNRSPSIYLGRHLNRTPADLRDSLLHEMIHQYLDQLKIVEQDDHGPVFQEEYLRVCGTKYLEP